MSIQNWVSVSSWKKWIQEKFETTDSNNERAIVPVHNVRTTKNSEGLDLQLLDPTIKTNALKILNLHEEDLKEEGLLERNYERLVSKLSKSEAKLPPLYANAMRQRIENAHGAYKTLSRVTKK